MNQLATLCAALGREPDDLISITQRADDKLKLIGFYKVKDVPSLELAGDVYFSVNPLDPEKVAQLEFGKRGGSDCVSRLTTLWIDLDSKKSGMGSEGRCTAFVEHMSQVLGVSPVAVVHTGTGGMHPYWSLSDSIPPSLLRAWGELVKSEAKEFGGSVDSVFDPARILRVPGTIRANGSAVSLQENPDPLAIEAEQLTQLVLPYVVTGTKITATAVAFETWKPAQQTCPYVLSMIERWPDEQPNDRHHWLLNKMNRLMAAARLGCITTEDFNTGERTAIQRFRELVFDRGERDGEIMEIIDRAKQDTERKTEQYLHEQELGGHKHREVKEPGSWKRKNLREALKNPDARPKPALWQREDGIFLLYPGCTHSVHGESESGKSMLMQWEVAQQLKSGALVLYLDYEDTEWGVGERLELMGVTLDQMDNLYYINPEQDYGSTEEDKADFETLLELPFSLCIIDGVTVAMLQAPAVVEKTGGGNDAAAAWQKRLPRVIANRTGAAVVMIDHVSKSNGGRMAIGGQSKMSSLTGASYVVTPTEPLGRGLIGRLKIEVGKDRPGYVRAHAVGKLNESRLQNIAIVEVDGTNDQLTVRTLEPEDNNRTRTVGQDEALMQRISELLQQNPEGLSGKAIREALGMGSNSCNAAIKSLTESGYVSKAGAGPTTKLHHTKPYLPTGNGARLFAVHDGEID